MSAVGKIIAGTLLIVAAVVAAPFTGGLSLNLIPIGVSLVAQGIIQLIRGKPSTPTDIAKVNVRLSEPVRWLDAGICRQGGAIVFAEFDDDGNLWYVVVHGDSILVNRLEVYLDDFAVTLDGSGNVIDDDFCLDKDKNAYNAAGGGIKYPYTQLWTATYSASDPTPPAVSALAAAFPSIWTADHKLVGTTYTVVKMKALEQEHRHKIYKWRGPLGLGEPSVGLIGKWSTMYDPRDVGQTLGDATTYEFSRNPPLLWAWFRTHRYGRNKSTDSINWDRIAEQADICDEVVTGLVGTHIRYECGIAIPDDKTRNEAEQEILRSMDAQLVFDDDGKCWPRVGYYEAPTLNLYRNRDIVAMESIEAVDGESETQGVIVRYTDPDAKYTVQPSAPWYNPLYYTPGEQAIFLVLDVLTCQDHNQAMRLAKAEGMRAQPLHRISPTSGLRGLKARQERIFNLQYDNTFAGDYEITSPVEIDPVGVFCAFVAVPVDEDRWSLLPGEEKPKPVIDDIDTTYSPDLPTGVVFIYNNGRIEATFDAPNRFDVGYEFQYVPTVAAAGDQWFSMTVQMVNLFAYSSAITSDIEYSMRYRSVAASGRPSDWSSPYDTITGTTVFPAPTSFSVTPGVGTAVVGWRNPTDSRFSFVRVYRHTAAVFGSATDITGAITGGLGQVQGFTDTIAAGTYYYWIVAYMADSTPSATVGPITAVVT